MASKLNEIACNFLLGHYHKSYQKIVHTIERSLALFMGIDSQKSRSSRNNAAALHKTMQKMDFKASLTSAQLIL